MQDIKHSCHGQFEGLMPCSSSLRFALLYKLRWRIKLIVYHLHLRLQSEGFSKTLHYSFRRIAKMFGIGAGRSNDGNLKIRPVRDDEVLNLQPGEWVEVKSRKEIFSILDEKGGYKGLYWMLNMWKHCGKRYRVYKRLKTMRLESNAEYRSVKNTVLLEGVTCDGEEWFGCDRSCYHFWREVWLKRVEPPKFSAGQ